MAGGDKRDVLILLSLYSLITALLLNASCTLGLIYTSASRPVGQQLGVGMAPCRIRAGAVKNIQKLCICIMHSPTSNLLLFP
jgi:hypothetical protein